MIAGGVALSLLHALIPNHWAPLVAIGRSEGWSRRQTLSVTAVAGFAHTASTVIIGMLVGVAGLKLTDRYASVVALASPAILLGLGVVFIMLDRAGRGRHGHHHHNGDAHERAADAGGKSLVLLTLSLATMMFFSPCLEIEAYFFTAVNYGWLGILSVAGIYTFLTVAGMLVFVYLGLAGASRLRWHFLEHHERLLTGILLAILGVVNLFLTL